MARQKQITWIDEEGYTCSKWVPLTREEEIAADVAESQERQSKLIFGYTWEQIQAKQAGR
jgi:hypothetical protein